MRLVPFLSHPALQQADHKARMLVSGLCLFCIIFTKTYREPLIYNDKRTLT